MSKKPGYKMHLNCMQGEWKTSRASALTLFRRTGKVLGCLLITCHHPGFTISQNYRPDWERSYNQRSNSKCTKKVLTLSLYMKSSHACGAPVKPTANRVPDHTHTSRQWSASWLAIQEHDILYSSLITTYSLHCLNSQTCLVKTRYVLHVH